MSLRVLTSASPAKKNQKKVFHFLFSASLSHFFPGFLTFLPFRAHHRWRLPSSPSSIRGSRPWSSASGRSRRKVRGEKEREKRRSGRGGARAREREGRRSMARPCFCRLRFRLASFCLIIARTRTRSPTAPRVSAGRRARLPPRRGHASPSIPCPAPKSDAKQRDTKQRERT